MNVNSNSNSPVNFCSESRRFGAQLFTAELTNVVLQPNQIQHPTFSSRVRILIRNCSPQKTLFTSDEGCAPSILKLLVEYSLQPLLPTIITNEFTKVKSGLCGFISSYICILVFSCSKKSYTENNMEAKVKCGFCRRGVLFPTSTTVYGCYKCQRIIRSYPNEQAKIKCSGCGGEFIVPIKTTAYRCSICQAVTTTSSGHGQLIPDSPIPGQKLKLESILFKRNQPDRSHQSSSSSTGSSSTLCDRCNKRALLCGVSYKKKRYKLKGTINDVMNMREMLVKIFDFPKESIRILTEEEKDSHFVPTKKNMLESLKWLVEGCQPGDSLVFYFSGHGLQQPDLKEDELDGFDETLCPVDFLREGMIIDNDLNSILVWPLKNGVTLHAIVDACHSGTILDLSYVYNLENHEWEDNKPPAKVPMRKHTSGGLAICFSACEDSQMAVDTSAFRKGMQGVMTHLFIKAIKDNPDITYGGILEKVQEGISEINQKSCCPRIFDCPRQLNILQVPILSSSEKFDAFERTFTL